MPYLIYSIIGLYLLFGITWISYLAVMHLKHNKDKITTIIKVSTTPILLILILIYVVTNLILGSILFLEFPKTLQFTSRCQRHIAKNDGSWRYKQAVWWCKNFLDPFEEGGHC
jgi:hypothetical protein